MPRSTTIPWSNQTTQSISLSIPVMDAKDNYFPGTKFAKPNSTYVKLFDQNMPSDLPEVVTYVSYDADKVSTNEEVVPTYDKSGKGATQIVVKDEWVERTLEPDGVTLHDDKFSIYVTIKRQTGSNIITGSDLLTRFCKLIGVMFPVVAVTEGNDTTYTLDTSMMDKLLRGTTTPYNY